MGCKQIRASLRQTPLAALCTSLCRARLMRSQQEMRALGKGHGVDFALKMTFKCLKPGEDAAYPGPTVEGGWGGREGYWERIHLQPPFCARPCPSAPLH